MNGSSAQNLIDWRTSRCCKLITAALMSVLVLAGSLILPASASAVNTSDWIELETDPHFYFCENISYDQSLLEINVGYSFNRQLTKQYGFAFSCGMRLYKDTTYQLTLTQPYESYQVATNFCVLDDLPSLVSDLSVQKNSLNVAYLDCIDIQTGMVRIDGQNYRKYYITFSTANGYVDNYISGPNGYNYVSLLEICDIQTTGATLGNRVNFSVMEISAKCIFDPSAEYYNEITAERQNKLVDLTKESVGKMKESLEQVTIVDDMSSAVDYVSGTIGKAAALISPTATFAGDTVNIYPAFALFSNIYNNVMGSVDPALLALAATVPLLCFLAWLFSSLFKSIL